MIEEISHYLQQNPRYKLIVSKEEIDFVDYMDVGKHLSFLFQDLQDYKNLHFKVTTAIEQLMVEGTGYNEQWGNYVGFKNPGFLFEPGLDISLPLLLKNYTTLKPVFLHWPGEMDGKNFYFLTKQAGLHIDLNDISFLTI